MVWAVKLKGIIGSFLSLGRLQRPWLPRYRCGGELSWRTIEDSDPRWGYDGFTSQPRHWNASGTTLAFGQSNCTAQMSFTGTAVQYYAYRSPTSGSVRISLDGIEQGDFDLKTDRDPEGQYYVKVFEAMNLEDTEHTLRIACDSTETQKTIDMLSVIGQN